MVPRSRFREQRNLHEGLEAVSGCGVGCLLATKFGTVHVWDEDLYEDLVELGRGSLLIVLATHHPRRPKRLNPEMYRKVLTTAGIVGWVHLDNCEPVE